MKVTSKQRLGTGAIKSHIPLTKLEKNANSQNRKGTYGQLSEQLFPKRWLLSNLSRTKNYINKDKMESHKYCDNKHRQQRATTDLPPRNSQ